MGDQVDHMSLTRARRIVSATDFFCAPIFSRAWRPVSKNEVRRAIIDLWTSEPRTFSNDGFSTWRDRAIARRFAIPIKDVARIRVRVGWDLAKTADAFAEIIMRAYAKLDEAKSNKSEASSQ